MINSKTGLCVQLRGPLNTSSGLHPLQYKKSITLLQLLIFSQLKQQKRNKININRRQHDNSFNRNTIRRIPIQENLAFMSVIRCSGGGVDHMKICNIQPLSEKNSTNTWCYCYQYCNTCEKGQKQLCSSTNLAPLTHIVVLGRNHKKLNQKQLKNIN